MGLRKGIKRRIAVVAIWAFALIASAATIAQPQRVCETPAQRIVCTVNNIRTSHHLRPLATTQALTIQARSKAIQGVPATAARVHGDNTAWGFLSTRLAVRAWMKSPGHRANILDPRYRYTGAAVNNGIFVQEFES